MNRKPIAYNNRLGIKGWVYGGRYTIERYLYLGHRLSGLGLIAYMVLHIIETANRIRGEQAWSGLMALFASPPFKVIEYLLFAAAVFHAMNGVRLIGGTWIFLGQTERACVSVFHLCNAPSSPHLCGHDPGWLAHHIWRFEYVL
jgi:succinate dehydrogenase/fumarate reductase cytochrome b subunit